MKTKRLLILFAVLININAHGQYIKYTNIDPRYIRNGSKLPSECYVDQPYVIVCDDGSWLCTMTTSPGTERARMNHIVATKSYDQGKTWTNLENIESQGGPQSSWAVPLKVPNGRIYVFYNYNKNRLKGAEAVFSGPFMFKYSDDNGKTWSEKRYEVPWRITQIDRDNNSNGKYQFFWSIDKPVITDNAAYIAFSKIFINFNRTEGFILKSKNILTEKNPEKIKWQMLPKGDTGICDSKFGKVQAEHNMVILNNENLYVVNRTTTGSPTYAISSDGGNTFTKPQFMRYANGERMGTPRACPKIHKTKDGKYLFWFHNNFRKQTHNGRNPVWLSGGIEKNGTIVWSQPEIVLYDKDPELLGMSYPDYIEQGGRMWLIETQKHIARIHKVDLDLLQEMWKQGKDAEVIQNGLIMDVDEEMMNSNNINFPSLPSLINGGGFSIGLWLTVNTLKPDQQILSTFGPRIKGVKISISKDRAIKILINDGERRMNKLEEGQIFISDAKTITKNQLHHIVFIVDGAAKIVSIVVDGILSDGGIDTRPYGWGRIYPYMQNMNDTYKCFINPSFDGKVHHIRVYDRYFRTSEAIANYNAGIK